jgi:hypothetical protein
MGGYWSLYHAPVFMFLRLRSPLPWTPVLHPPLSTRAASGCPPSAHASRRSLDSLLIAAAVTAQGAALAWTAASGGAGALVLPAAAAALCVLAWEARGRVPHLDLVVAAAAFGGLGMVAATAAGMGGHAAHGAMAHGSPAAHGYGGAVVGMLLVCVPACAWRCAPLGGGGLARRALALLVSTAGMLAGMAAGGWLAGPRLAALLGPAAGMHVAMVVGMAAGTAAAIPAAALLGRAPRHTPQPQEAAWPA